MSGAFAEREPMSEGMRKPVRHLRLLAFAVVCLLACLGSSGAYAAALRADSAAIIASVPDEAESEAAGNGQEPRAEAAENEEEPEEQQEEESEGEGEGALQLRSHARKHSSGCVVPSIDGSTLSGARSALSRAHCSLGKISTPASRHGSLVVVWQSHPRGSRLAHGSAVSVRLAVKSRRR